MKDREEQNAGVDGWGLIKCILVPLERPRNTFNYHMCFILYQVCFYRTKLLRSKYVVGIYHRIYKIVFCKIEVSLPHSCFCLVMKRFSSWRGVALHEMAKIVVA